MSDKDKPPKDAKSMVVTVGNPSWFPPPVSWSIDVADIMARVEKLVQERGLCPRCQEQVEQGRCPRCFEMQDVGQEPAGEGE